MKSDTSFPLKLLACFVISALSSTAPAHAVTFQELANSDLVNSGTLTTVSLDVGTNTVSGNFGYSYSTRSTDFDSFAFLVGAGTVLESITVQLTPSAGNTHDLSHANWSFRSGSNAFYGGAIMGNLTWNTPGPAALSGVFGQGTYNLTNNELNFTGPVQATAKADYTFTLTVATVAPIPEPETYAMMLAGLGLIGGIARRKKQHQASA